LTGIAGDIEAKQYHQLPKQRYTSCRFTKFKKRSTQVEPIALCATKFAIGYLYCHQQLTIFPLIKTNQNF
jgi:hypothetical protein